MKTLLRHCTVAFMGLLMMAPLTAAMAQDKAVVVVSIAPLQKVFADIQYVAEAAGQAEVGGFIPIFAAPFTTGIDKSRPQGVVLMTDGQAFTPLVFVPVTSFDDFQGMLEGQFGAAEDAGDGAKMLEVTAGPAGAMPVFFKENNGWVFVAQDKEKLGNVPADPAALLGNLPNDYFFAIQGNMQNVPELYREMLVQQIMTGAELALIQEADETDEEFAKRRNRTKKQLSQVERLFNEFAGLTIGFNVDQTTKTVNLDMSYSVVPDTQMARQLVLNLDLSSDFAGIIADNAAFSMHMTAKVTDEDIATVTEQMEQLREAALDELDIDEAEKETATKVVNLLFDAYIETVKTGKIDLAASLDLSGDSLAFISGGKVADGRQIEDSVKELAKLMEDNPEFPGINWDSDSYKGISFHSMSIPLPADEEEAQKIFGEKLDVILGIGDQSVYFVFGGDASAQLKSAIDLSIQNAGQAVESVNMTVALLPIFNFVKSFQPDDIKIQAGIEALQGASDKIVISGKLIDGTTGLTRISIQEGVLKAIGAAATAQPEPAELEEAPGF